MLYPLFSYHTCTGGYVLDMTLYCHFFCKALKCLLCASHWVTLVRVFICSLSMRHRIFLFCLISGNFGALQVHNAGNKLGRRCDMCSNYEKQLQGIQIQEAETRDQVSFIRGTELSPPRLFLSGLWSVSIWSWNNLAYVVVPDFQLERNRALGIQASLACQHHISQLS